MEFGVAASKLKELFSSEGSIRVISHIDADGISSAAIIVKILKQYDQSFWLSTVRQLEDSIIDRIEKQITKSRCKAVIFLDLGAGKIDKIAELAKHTKVFVIDHHPFNEEVKENENLHIVHSIELSAACLCYCFARALGASKDLAQFAIVGMIGDILSVSKFNVPILNEAQESGMKIQKSLPFFSATRPLHKSLELGSEIYIPGVTGNSAGALKMLREAGIEIKKLKTWRSLIDLSEEEISRLITAIVLRLNDNNCKVIDNVYIIKIAERLWDGREISTMLNACGRLGRSSLGVSFLLGSKDAREELDSVYSEYRHHLIKALNWVENSKKIQGSAYVIIDAKNAIKDTMIGTIMSILSRSYIYPSGTIIVGMAHRDDDKIKISARIAKSSRGRENSDGNCEANLNKLLSSVVKTIGGEVGGHIGAAGALILKENESSFLESLQRELNIEEIKVKVA